VCFFFAWVLHIVLCVRRPTAITEVYVADMDYRRRRPLTASDCSDSNTKLDGCLKLRTLNWRYFICLLVTPVVQHCAVLVHPLKVKHRRFLRIYSQLHSYSAGTLILAGYHSSKIIYLKNDINCDIFITTPRFKVVTYTTIFSHSARKCQDYVRRLLCRDLYSLWPLTSSPCKLESQHAVFIYKETFSVPELCEALTFRHHEHLIHVRRTWTFCDVLSFKVEQHYSRRTKICWPLDLHLRDV